jgi:O-antigen/teichoic acid export membrane protein
MLKKIGFSYIAIYLITIITFINGVLVARYFGPEGKGLLTSYFFIPTAIILYSEFGINESIVQYISSGYRISKSFLIKTYLIIIFIGLTILFIYSSYFNDEFLNLGSLGPLTLILLFSNQLLDSFFKGRFEINIFNINNLLKAFLFLVIVIIGIYHDFSIIHIFEGYIIVLILSIIHLLIRIRFLKFDKPTPIIQQKKLISFSLKSYIFKVLNSTESIFDKLIIVTILSNIAFGEYSVAVALSSLCYLVLVSPISKILLPILNKLELQERVLMAINLSKTSFIIIFFLGILIIIFSDVLVTFIYGNEFKNASVALSILMVGVILKTPMPFLTHFYKSINKPEVLVNISLVSLPFNIVGSLVLIPLMGILGAAIVSSITYSLYSFLLVYKFTKYTKSTLSQLLKFNIMDFKLLIENLKTIS